MLRDSSFSILLPPFARVNCTLPLGEHPFLALLPAAAESPAMALIETSAFPRGPLLEQARVRISPEDGFCWIDETVPAIVLTASYYHHGAGLDLYLDLLHELTHLRQLAEGHDIWDERFAYVDRPTEIEGYAVATEEGRRLGMSDDEILRHLNNPWMSAEEIQRLLGNVAAFLARGLQG